MVMDVKVKEIIEKIKKGELEPLAYTTINEKGENNSFFEFFKREKDYANCHHENDDSHYDAAGR